TIEKFINYYKSRRLYLFLPNIDTGRMERLYQVSADSPMREILPGEMNIELIVGDARRTEFPDDTFDLICSNNTFEHIPLTVLQSILLELNRILKPTGVMSHSIDMSDHFAHFDRSLSSFNFLKYSERQWRFINNSLLTQNRLKLSDFLTLFQECGFKTLIHEDRMGNRSELSRVPLNKKFKRYAAEDLLVTHSLIVSRK
ncbi:MAG: class I SAM-dependent methyltransferase, partial [Candidatus Kryptoniota bacterium]